MGLAACKATSVRPAPDPCEAPMLNERIPTVEISMYLAVSVGTAGNLMTGVTTGASAPVVLS